MTYVLSDIHGCYDKYRKMLKLIHFSDKDTLYVLGDAVDRGPDGIKILLDIAGRKNVVFLRGNHDETAREIFGFLFSDTAANEKTLTECIRAWTADGGAPTLRQFLEISGEDRKTAFRVLSNALIYDEITVMGRQYFLSHTVPGRERMHDFDHCTIDDFIWGMPDYNEVYFNDKIIITGHTPTELIDKNSTEKIYMKNNHIAVDCGAVFGGPLGCICLDTMQEFYV